MPTAALHFPGGRYHATPWGHHVNEGQVEWPPSPWRLLRALIATGYTTQQWSEIPPTGRRLFESLAAVLPSYQLPPATAAHSRHYMPLGTLGGGTEKTTLVFDTWAHVGDGELIIRWPCEIDDEMSDLFRTLVRALGYLGRSESWVDGRVLMDDVEFVPECVAWPHADGEYPGPEWEQVSLMSCVGPSVYADWRAAKSEAAVAALPLPAGQKQPSKSLQKKRASAVAPYPSDLLTCLQMDTAWWRRTHGWSQPPGSQRTLYWRPVNSLVVSAPPPLPRPVNEPVDAMLLALTTPSGRTSALPHLQRALPQGELFHRAVVGLVGKGQKVHCPELTGRDSAGRPLRDGHRHAYVLPLDLDGDQRLDHLLVYAPMGLGNPAQEAIRALKQTWTKGLGDLQVAVVGSGALDSLRNLATPFVRQIACLLGPLHGAKTWRSMTPFVPPRHVKKHGSNAITGQIQAELRSRGFPIAEHVEVQRDESVRFRHFVRVRHHGGPPPPNDVGYAIRLQLSQPVTGPIALGYASHFGLGIFAADERQDR